MDQSALELFLAESTALAVIGEFDAHGAMSSALNKRHKVRHADLSNVLRLANAQGAGTYERAVLVFHLVLLGGGAYENPQTIVDASDLNALKVKPHWASANAHNFNTCCLWEPMNLWAGWANENQSMNNQTIDPHMLNYFTNSTQIFTDLSPQSVRTTPNMEIADTLLPGASAHTNIPAPQGRQLQRRPSAHSNMLLNHQNFIKAQMDDFHEHAKQTTDSNLQRQEMERFLRNAQTLETTTTAAGDAHYNELLRSLVGRGMNGLDVYKRIEFAQRQWITFRAQLRVVIDQYADWFRQSSIQNNIFLKPAFTTGPNKRKR